MLFPVILVSSRIEKGKKALCVIDKESEYVINSNTFPIRRTIQIGGIDMI